MSIFADALNDIFSNPDFGVAATYTPPGPAAAVPVSCTAILAEPDQPMNTGGRFAVSAPARTADIRVSEVPLVKEGGTLRFDGRCFKITAPEQPDSDRLIWRVGLSPIAV